MKLSKTAIQSFFVLLITSSLAIAASMDAQLNMAKRSVADIEKAIQTIKKGDIAQYNKLSAKLTKASEQLQATESKTHPDYLPTVQKWSAMREAMVDIAQQWQTAPSQSATAASSVQGNPLDTDAILAKYQRQNRPKLPEKPSPDEARKWAEKTQSLRNTELQADLALLNQASIDDNTKQRVANWISGSFQEQIVDDVRSAVMQNNGVIMTASQLAQQINAISADDKMRIFNFAQGENGKRNAETLSQGLRAGDIATTYNQVFSLADDPQRQQHLSVIDAASERFEKMQKQAVDTASELAAMPKKKAKRNSAFLKSIAQEFWLNGSVFAEIDRKGNVWIGSTEVGDIESNGKIWVRGNQLGSIETNGKVWFRGNHIGTLEENGKVWRSGSQIGLIESNGKVWIGGNSNGEITPFEGEWKRAAILYYFKDVFADAF